MYFWEYCKSTRQEIRIQQLTDEKNSLQERLKTADDTVERHIKQIENLTLQLGEAERTLAEKEEDMELKDKSSKDEVSSHSKFWLKNLKQLARNIFLKRTSSVQMTILTGQSK